MSQSKPMVRAVPATAGVNAWFPKKHSDIHAHGRKVAVIDIGEPDHLIDQAVKAMAPVHQGSGLEAKACAKAILKSFHLISPRSK
jgi:hypothetical protein